MNTGYNFYRIKMAYRAEADDGAIVPVKTEDLVMATCYTEAEKIAYELMQGKDKFGDVNYEIAKTKIDKVLYNDTFCTGTSLLCGLVEYYFEEPDDTEIGLYAVAAIVYVENERTQKTKAEKHTIYVPAESPKDAIRMATTYLNDTITMNSGVTVRNVKYDNAQSVMVTTDTHQANVA